MSKDELIADLREQVATLSHLLELALGPKPLGDSTERTRRYREKHGNVTGTSRERHGGTSPERHCDVPGGLIGGVPPVSLGNDPGDVPQEDEATGKGELGKSPRRGAERHRNVTVTPDENLLAFKAVFPKTDRTSWKEAQREFAKLSPEDQVCAIGGARIYAGNEPGEYTKGAQSWLRERRWETAAERPPASAGNGQRAKNDPTLAFQHIADWGRRENGAEREP